MAKAFNPSHLGFFSSLVAAGSLVLRREQGVSTAAVSKHLMLMESRLDLTLANRTTRRMESYA